MIKIGIPTGSEETDLVINPYRQLTSQQEKFILMTTIHELTHQRTSETIGPTNYARVDLDSLFFDDQLRSLAPQELTDKIDLQKRIHQGYRPAPDLFQVMDEGIATSAEQALSSRHIRDLRLNGDNVEAYEFKEVQRARFDSLRDERDGLNEEALHAVYSTGFAIIGNLARSLGQEKLLKFLQNIDIHKAQAILIGSPKFNSIINSQNPSKLIPQKRR